MKETLTILPTDIGKHPKLIKNAQDDMATIDVLVCGRCLNVFHFVEDFQDHKRKPCHKESNSVRECNDTKPKIWAFLLWKATQLHNIKETSTNNPNSWALYQTWVKMDDSIRETWIVAGRTIQSFNRVSSGGLQEMPVKITKTVVNNADPSPTRKPITQSKPQVTNLKPANKLQTIIKSEPDNEPTSTRGAGTSNTMQKIIKKPITTNTTQLTNKPSTSSSVTISSKPVNRRVKRTGGGEEETEEFVEKIVAKRFNPRRKMHEFLVKWDGRAHDQNSWEPAINLECVPHLLEIFEKQLARQKEQRAALQAKQAASAAAAAAAAAAATKVDTTKNGIDVSKKIGDAAEQSPDVDSVARPTRSSKTKAMDQVKQWVSAGAGGGGTSSASMASPSSMNEESNTLQGEDDERNWSNTTPNASNLMRNKRKLDDSDYNDSNASDLPSTTATMEDLEEDLIPSHTVKRLKNGSAVAVESTKVLKVNGTTSRPSSVSSESLPTKKTTGEAAVIVTQDQNASGIMLKPGYNSTMKAKKSEAQIRILSKGESAITSTGIVPISSALETLSTTSTPEQPQPRTRVQQLRSAGGVTARQTSPTQAPTVTTRQTVQRTPGGTIIQRRTISTPTGGGVGQRQQTPQQHHVPSRNTPITSSAGGRLTVPRVPVGGGGAAAGTPRPNTKNVTPEQKILQLSKSGDLKVTKKVMTREDAAAQRNMTPQQRQQQLRQQQQQQQHQQQQQQQQQLQSNLQVQKVQQQTVGRTGNVTTISVRKQSESSNYSSEEHQAQLCPITGKLIGAGGEEQQSQLEATTQQQIAMQQESQLQDIDSTLLLNEHQVLTNEDGTPVIVTGEDGTVYQVAGKNAEGQTILVTHGPDGEQQYAYVAAPEGEENQVLTIDNAVAEAVAQLPVEQQAEALAAAAGEGQYLVKTTQEDGTTQVVAMTEAELAQHQALAAAAAGGATAVTTTGQQLCIQTGTEDGQETNIPAEVVQAELPSPGGTRRVVLLLQDGTFMMTTMHDDEFKALNITT